MGWDGSEFWTLPRAARALETGFSVFTIQRVFQCANKASLQVLSWLNPVNDSYTWGPEFNIQDFQHQIEVFNLRQVTEWLDGDESFMKDHKLDEDGAEFRAAARLPLTAGSTIFEALYAFHCVNNPTKGESQEVRLRTQLFKRAIRATVDDEFSAFARRVGRRTIWVNRFYNHEVYFEEIEGQLSDENEEDK
ncbi:hypothetical protein DFH09DRAFT_1300148 [Mycena vulgaris]|nr:hypothetical protein DFH09DRAFT_1300148 [Mycena vulgaris]